MKTIDEWIEHWEFYHCVDLTDPDAPIKEIDPRTMPRLFKAIRDEALEEAAKLCDAVVISTQPRDWDCCVSVMNSSAATIRALKDSP